MAEIFIHEVPDVSEDSLEWDSGAVLCENCGFAWTAVFHSPTYDMMGRRLRCPRCKKVAGWVDYEVTEALEKGLCQPNPKLISH